MQANTILQVKPLSFGNPLDKPADLRVMRLNQGDRDDRPDEFGGHCGGERPAIQGFDGQLKVVLYGISVQFIKVTVVVVVFQPPNASRIGMSSSRSGTLRGFAL